MKIVRQGDVLLVKVDSDLPKDARKREAQNGRVILATGEATGHAHAVDARSADLYLTGATEFLSVKIATKLVHEEHEAIPLDRGLYRIVHQREYRPESDVRVID